MTPAWKRACRSVRTVLASSVRASRADDRPAISSRRLWIVDSSSWLLAMRVSSPGDAFGFPISHAVVTTLCTKLPRVLVWSKPNSGNYKMIKWKNS
jgi:hypothetical protein